MDREAPTHSIRSTLHYGRKSGKDARLPCAETSISKVWCGVSCLYTYTHSTQLTILYLQCRTFAYTTVTERMPRILAQVVDALNKLEASIRECHGDVSDSFFTLAHFMVDLVAGWSGGAKGYHRSRVRAALPDADRQAHGSHYKWARCAAVECSVCCL